MKVLSIGEIIFDIYGNRAVIGGAPLNFCAHCAACGAQSAIISAWGKDSLALKAKEYLEKFNVASNFVEESDLPTGQCLVTVNNGIPSYNVLRPAAYDSIELAMGTDAVKNYNPDVFAFGTLIQREEKSRNALKKIIEECSFENIFCDINLRKGCYDAESCLMCLDNATILKLSDEEEPLLSVFGFYENTADEKQKLLNICDSFENIRIIVYTKGVNGSLVYSAAEKRFYEFEAVKTQVVSTVGAGDSYSAAFLCEFLKSGDIGKAGKAGAELSGFVVSHLEAVPKK